MCCVGSVHVIDQTRGRVFHQDIQTPRSVLKNEAVGRVFSQLRGVWISWWNTLPSVWYSISNTSVFKEKIEMKVGLILCKCFITYPNSVSVLISFVFPSWIINEFEIYKSKYKKVGVLPISKALSNVSSIRPLWEKNMFLSDEGPTLKTLDCFHIGSTPTFLYFDL